MKKELLKAIVSKEFIEIYTDVDHAAKFEVGKVLKFSEDFVLLASVSPIGMYDGFHLLTTDDIYQINKNTKYINNIKKLYTIKQQSHLDFDGKNEHLMLSLLKFAVKNKLVIFVKLFQEGMVQGLVKKIENEMLVVSILDDDGEYDGEAYIRLEDINSITCDDEQAVCLKLLSLNAAE
ncbi:hypothetical protein [Niallia sp. 03133]|uniref:hypothetical protein n=1 Tax=Niallia sp. 03133 TaxID=3458060 RepID=UPI004043FA98